MGRDHTLYSLIDGYVKFEGKSKQTRRISVYPDAPAIGPTGLNPATD